jgi:hypothetical protein
MGGVREVQGEQTGEKKREERAREPIWRGDGDEQVDENREKGGGQQDRIVDGYSVFSPIASADPSQRPETAAR